MSLNDMDSPESDNRKFAFPNMGDDPKVISQVSLDSFAETADSIDDGAALSVNVSKKRHLLWLWIVLAVMLLFGAVVLPVSCVARRYTLGQVHDRAIPRSYRPRDFRYGGVIDGSRFL